MITIKTMKQIPTAKVVRGFRSGGSRLSVPAADQSRIQSGYAQLLTEEARRQWLRDAWLAALKR
jgi:hypothetical protein